MFMQDLEEDPELRQLVNIYTADNHDAKEIMEDFTELDLQTGAIQSSLSTQNDQPASQSLIESVETRGKFVKNKKVKKQTKKKDEEEKKVSDE